MRKFLSLLILAAPLALLARPASAQYYYYYGWGSPSLNPSSRQDDPQLRRSRPSTININRNGDTFHSTINSGSRTRYCTSQLIFSTLSTYCY